MARVFKRAGDPEWWLDFVENGRRRRVKTNTTSKRAAEDLLAEKRADLKRVQLGLEVAPVSQVRTLGDAWEMWLSRWCPAASKRREAGRFNANVKGTKFALAPLAEINGDQLQAWFARKLEDQAPRTVNGHRRIIRCIFNKLIQKRLFRGVNPVKETRPVEEPERAYELLTEMEFKRVLQHVPAEWRPLFHLAFVTGLRRGELFALKKDRTIVDLDRAILTPRGSNAREMPKGRRIKSIPLTPAALDVVREAWNAAEYGGYLFPSRSGGLRSENLRTAEILRTAMVRAGLVEGWLHRCRSTKCRERNGLVEVRHADEQQRKCPRCGWILQPIPVVRPVRFHDIRHSTADYLLENGVAMEAVSDMLRHSTIVITQQYRHRTVEALRKAIDVKPGEGLERRLEQMAGAAPLPQATILREAIRKLALARHPGDAEQPQKLAKEE